MDYKILKKYNLHLRKKIKREISKIIKENKQFLLNGKLLKYQHNCLILVGISLAYRCLSNDSWIYRR